MLQIEAVFFVINSSNYKLGQILLQIEKGTNCGNSPLNYYDFQFVFVPENAL